jgi:hypothetical protein
MSVLRSDLVEAAWNVLMPSTPRHHPECPAITGGSCNCWAKIITKRIGDVLDVVEPLIRSDQIAEDQHEARLEWHEVRGTVTSWRDEVWDEYRAAAKEVNVDGIMTANGQLEAYKRLLDLLGPS